MIGFLSSGLRARPRGRQAGLTYMEVLAVAAIVLILSAAAIPMARWGARRTKERELRRNLEMLRGAIDRYHRDAVNGTIDLNQLDDISITMSGPPPARYYPPTLELLTEGAPMGGGEGLPGGEPRKIVYLREIPRDPFVEEGVDCDSHGWRLRSYQDDHDAPTWGGENVYDIRSCSDLPALDGETYYEEW